MSSILIFFALKKKQLPKVLSIVFMFVTIVGYFITTEAFSTLKARINWNTPILNIIFITSAIIGGMALYLLFSDKEDELVNKMPFKALLSLLLIIDFALFVISYLNASNLMILYLVIGNILPIIMIFMFINKSLLLRILTSLFILASIWFKRSDLISSGYTKSWMPTSQKIEYVSTNIEKLLVFNVFLLGIIGLVIIFTLINKNKEEMI
jgi:DMSO reductase anchor subunit